MKMSTAANLPDPTYYPVDEPVGEGTLHRFIVELLRPLVARWLAEMGQPTFVGSDQFIYYEQFNPHARLAPDVYVLPGVAPGADFSSWKLWETDIAPSFALEVVSSNWRKDYKAAPASYDQAGVAELIIFDPNHAARPDGVRWQRYARDRNARNDNGRLVLAARTSDPCIASTVLGCGLTMVGAMHDRRVRIVDANGRLFPTEAEHERRAKEDERQAKEDERRAKEAALASAAAGQARIAELEAALKRRG